MKLALAVLVFGLFALAIGGGILLMIDGKPWLFILAMVVHMKIGVKVVIEDYIYAKNQKVTLLILNTFFAWAIGLACVFAILKISFGV